MTDSSTQPGVLTAPSKDLSPTLETEEYVEINGRKIRKTIVEDLRKQIEEKSSHIVNKLDRVEFEATLLRKAVDSYLAGDEDPLAEENEVIIDYSPEKPGQGSRFACYSTILGSGAFKTVYRGLDTEEAQEVAWNEVVCRDFSEAERQRFLEEVDILRSLRHDNIIRFYDAWERTSKNGHRVIFATELMTSGTLKQYIRKSSAVRIKVVRSWCKQILAGLQYLHSRDPPIIHRDLKCDNIFVNGANGEVKIGDLGLATLKKNDHAVSLIGTPEFMAPEMYDEMYTESVDVYSFGMCVLEMITREYPYSECTNAAQVYKRVSSGIQPESLKKVENAKAYNFIMGCLCHHSKRLTIPQLLEHPFITDESTTLVPAKEGEGRGSASFNPSSQDEAELPESVDDLDVAFVEVEKDGEDDALKLKFVNMVQDEKEDTVKKNQVFFMYNMVKDDPEDVAKEMVDAKLASEDDCERISQSIRQIVKDYERDPQALIAKAKQEAEAEEAALAQAFQKQQQAKAAAEKRKKEEEENARLKAKQETEQQKIAQAAQPVAAQKTQQQQQQPQQQQQQPQQHQQLQQQPQQQQQQQQQPQQQQKQQQQQQQQQQRPPQQGQQQRPPQQPSTAAKGGSGQVPQQRPTMQAGQPSTTARQQVPPGALQPLPMERVPSGQQGQRMPNQRSLPLKSGDPPVGRGSDPEAIIPSMTRDSIGGGRVRPKSEQIPTQVYSQPQPSQQQRLSTTSEPIRTTQMTQRQSGQASPATMSHSMPGQPVRQTSYHAPQAQSQDTDYGSRQGSGSPAYNANGGSEQFRHPQQQPPPKKGGRDSYIKSGNGGMAVPHPDAVTSSHSAPPSEFLHASNKTSPTLNSTTMSPTLAVHGDDSIQRVKSGPSVMQQPGPHAQLPAQQMSGGTGIQVRHKSMEQAPIAQPIPQKQDQAFNLGATKMSNTPPTGQVRQPQQQQQRHQIQQQQQPHRGTAPQQIPPQQQQQQQQNIQMQQPHHGSPGELWSEFESSHMRGRPGLEVGKGPRPAYRNTVGSPRGSTLTVTSAAPGRAASLEDILNAPDQALNMGGPAAGTMGRPIGVNGRTHSNADILNTEWPNTDRISREGSIASDSATIPVDMEAVNRKKQMLADFEKRTMESLSGLGKDSKTAANKKPTLDQLRKNPAGQM
eukprot:Clim_evm19s78 gene=Clim_evmTU19s78